MDLLEICGDIRIYQKIFCTEDCFPAKHSFAILFPLAKMLKM